MHRYGAFRLMSNLVYTYPKEIKPFAEAELPVATALTRPSALISSKKSNSWRKSNKTPFPNIC